MLQTLKIIQRGDGTFIIEDVVPGSTAEQVSLSFCANQRMLTGMPLPTAAVVLSGVLINFALFIFTAQYTPLSRQAFH